jgi:hypothetical protein
VIRFKEMNGKEAEDSQAIDFINQVARDTKELNELVKAGQTFVKMK